MFWKFNLLTTSRVDTLLDKEDVTLRELMDEEDIIQECKGQNRKLVDYLTQPQMMEDLVTLIIQEPSEEVEEKLRFKYANTACELLTSDAPQINDKLAGDEELVKKLYSFLESEQPLNPLLSSFFSKVMGLLITRKSEMIFTFLKSRDNFVESLLRHIGTSAIMDLLLRLITCIESAEIRRGVIEWLNEQKVVEKLVACLDPALDEGVHCNAAQSLCDIVRLGREQIMGPSETVEPDPLLVTMEKEETVGQLLNNMFNSGKNESVIVNGLFVIHTLLEVRRPLIAVDGPGDTSPCLEPERMSQGMQSVLAAIKPRLTDFHHLLLDPPKQRYSNMPTTFGGLDPPLGNSRLQVAKLVAALLSTNTPSINAELASLGTMGVMLNLYFKYVWNNFLHTQVEQCFNMILNQPASEVDGQREHPLLTQLMTGCKLIQRLLDEWDENDQLQSRDGGRRKGFMGHLTKMVNTLNACMEKGENAELLKELMEEIPESTRKAWEEFVSGKLAEVNKKNTVELIRGNPLASSSEDDDGDFRDIPFPQETAMQQAFSDYQLQQMTSSFIDQFGFNEDEFAEQEEKIDAPFSDRISSIDINIQADGESQQPSTALFDQICNERMQQFDDNDSDEEIWEEKPITYDKNLQKRPGRLPETRGSPSSDEDSTDSEEELDSPRTIRQQPAEKMEIDNTDGWVANFDEVPMEAGPVEMDTASPWDTTPQPKETCEENWADFTKLTAIESPPPFSNPEKGPRSSSPDAMDTTESSRINAYLVQSAPAEMETEVRAASKDLKLDSATCPGQNPLTPQPKNPAGDVKSATPPSPPVASNSPCGDKASPEKGSDPPAEAKVDEDDLNANFDFLTSAGLMKKASGSPPSQTPSSTPSASDVPPESPPQPPPSEGANTASPSAAAAVPGKEGGEKIEVPAPPESPVANGPV